MQTFAYKAINETGTMVSGVIESENAGIAENMLVARGLIPSRISEKKSASNRDFGTWLKEKLTGVKTGDLILFTKQFRSMLQAGVPILRLLQVLEAQTQNPNLKQASAAMGQAIKQGTTLYDAMGKHPDVFSPLYLSMIKAGEVSGTVPDVMSRLISIIEHEAKIKSDIKSALQYPMIVLIALSVAFVVLLTFVIPKFVTIFSRSGLALPIPTQIAMFLYLFLKNYWYALLGGIIALIVSLRMYFKTAQGRLAKDSAILRLPIFGPLFIKAAMSRFASIFAILQASGVPIMSAMAVLSGAIGNAAISRQFDRILVRIEQGQGIAAPLRSAKYFTPMVIDMVAIGEETGNIDEMLRVIAAHYDDEVSYSVKQLSDAIGPILVIGLAAVVGFFALSIFLPMWDLTKMVQK